MSNMSPIDWAQRPIQKYADFNGRAPRAEYWWFTLAVIIAYVVAGIIDDLIGMKGMVFGLYGPVSILLMLAILVPSLAVGIRRLHDTDRSGWWVAPPYALYAIAIVLAGPALARGEIGASAGIAGGLMMVAGICFIVLLIFFCLEGTKGDNKYGPDPYAGRA